MLDARRLVLLDALGVDVYVLRSRDPDSARSAADLPVSDLSKPGLSERGLSEYGLSQPRSPAEVIAAPVGSTAPRILIVCAAAVSRDARLARWFASLPRVFGIAPTELGWLHADAAGLITPPAEAVAYLVIGAQAARELGAHLSTMQQNTLTLVVTAEASALPGDAATKRALWHSMKPLVRRLRAEVN